MTEPKNINAQGEINAHVANRLAKLETNNLMLERRYDEILRQFATLEKRVETLEKQVDDIESTDFASENHYHDEYANIDHVERSEHSFNIQIHSLQNDLSNLEYRVNEVDRKAERAQSTADNAQRSSGRGGWY